MKKHFLILALASLAGQSLIATDRNYNASASIDELTQEDRNMLAHNGCCIEYDTDLNTYFFRSGTSEIAIDSITISDAGSYSGLFSTTVKKHVNASGRNFEITRDVNLVFYHRISILTALGAVGTAGAFTWKYMQQAKKASEDNS